MGWCLIVRRKNRDLVRCLKVNCALCTKVISLSSGFCIRNQKGVLVAGLKNVYYSFGVFYRTYS
uniref:Uncharacterized protein n=1 Tax=Hordeum vulgare subsp. vulgare TaxID=112509 RepID=A0A8I6Z2A7_HORVV